MVISVIAVVVALTLPAVQRSREAARQTVCQNRLKQLGLAVAGHEATFARYPAPVASWSLHAALLPWLDHEALAGHVDPDMDSLPCAPRALFGAATLTAFQCPSAPNVEAGIPFSGMEGQTVSSMNYLCNAGVKVWTPERKGFYDWFHLQGGPERFRDGLSNTTCFSERLVGIGGPDDSGASPGVLRDPDGLREPFGPREVEDRVAYLRDVLGLRPRPINHGYEWCVGSFYDAYDHTLPPQSAGLTVKWLYQSVVPASSAHAGAVNVVMMDRAVSQFSFRVSPAVWRAVGTRAGGEILSGSGAAPAF